MTERYEGYGSAIRRVMEQKEKNPGIVGVVADIIKVEKKYETAIETALGGSIQNIVTDDEETAERMIGFLKQTKAGRATFLPLNSIKNAQEFRQKDALKEPGVLGLAHTLACIRMGRMRTWRVPFWAGSWWWIRWTTPPVLRANTATACGS